MFVPHKLQFSADELGQPVVPEHAQGPQPFSFSLGPHLVQEPPAWA